MLLTVHDSLAPQVGGAVFRYDGGAVPAPFKAEETVSTGYTDFHGYVIVSWMLEMKKLA